MAHSPNARAPISGLPTSLILICLVLSNSALGTSIARAAEVRLLTLEDIEQMGGTDFDGGVGDYLLRNDKIEAVILAIGATPDFNIAYTPESLPSRGVLIDLATRGDRNDQLDEVHHLVDFAITTPVVYLGPAEGFPEPRFDNNGDTASITVFGISLSNSKLVVTSTYSVTDGNSWVDIETTVENTDDSPIVAFSVADGDVLVARGRIPFQPFPDRGPKPPPLELTVTGLLEALGVWSYLVSPGTNGPQQGPTNNDGTPAGEVCYAFVPTTLDEPLMGVSSDIAGISGNSFDIAAVQAGNFPTLDPGETLSFRRRLVVGKGNSVEACLDIALPLLYEPLLGFDARALFHGRVIDPRGNPIANAHIFFDNVAPGAPQYPAPLSTPVDRTYNGEADPPAIPAVAGAPLPFTHVLTDADGRFEVRLQALQDPAAGASLYTARIEAQERDTLEIGPLSVDDVTLASTGVDLGDLVVSGTGTLGFEVYELVGGDALAPTPTKLSIYGSGETSDPDFGSQYLSLRNFPGLNPFKDSARELLTETFVNSPALNFAVDADGAGSLELRPGTYTVYASHGIEYTLAQAEVTIVDGATTPLELVLERAVNTDLLVSMDAHIHSVKSFDASVPLTDRVVAYLAAGVEVMVGADHDYVTNYAPIIESIGAGDEIRSIVGNEVTGALPVPAGKDTSYVDEEGMEQPAYPENIGHWLVWPIPVIPGARRNGAQQDEFLSPATNIDRMRGVGSLPLLGARPSTATLAQWLAAIHAGEPGTPGEMLPPDDEVVMFNHPREGSIGLFNHIGGSTYNPKLPIDDFPNNLMLLRSLYHKDNVGPDGTETTGLSFDVVELINGGGLSTYMSVREDWFSLLDQGIHRTGFSNSDSHLVVLQNPGMGRSYIVHQTPNALDVGIDELIENVKAMRVMGTTGPVLRFQVLSDEDLRDRAMPPELRPRDRDRFGLDEGVGERLFPPLLPTVFNGMGETVVATGRRVLVRIRVEAAPWIPVEEVRIFVNGVPARVFPIPPEKVAGGPALRFSRFVALGNVDTDAYLVIEAGVKVDESGNPTTPGILDLMGKIEPGIVPFGFTNPVFVDRDGNGYEPPGLNAGGS